MSILTKLPNRITAVIYSTLGLLIVITDQLTAVMEKYSNFTPGDFWAPFWVLNATAGTLAVFLFIFIGDVMKKDSNRWVVATSTIAACTLAHVVFHLLFQ